MQHVLELRKYDLVGIVNGIDYDSWDSQTDQYLVRNYSLETIESKRLINWPYKHNLPFHKMRMSY